MPDTPRPGPERRQRPSQPRRLNERRAPLLILNSATQEDIYLWAVALVIMGIIIGVFIILATMSLAHVD